jgi:eukaryotic-like serine/threonine-protein kinase
MKAERWQEIQRLFDSVASLPATERDGFLAEACSEDDSLRDEVKRLLLHRTGADHFLNSPAIEVAARAMGPLLESTLAGRIVSHYRIIEKIGEGGMGEVFLAEDISLSRKVAIKTLPRAFSNDPERLARFDREAKVLAALNHPNIAAIYGLERTDSGPVLVMELVEGESLAQRIAKGVLSVEDALEVCRQIAEGLEAAHDKGIVHRDLKPANVKLTPEGKVKILDFGLAKVFHAESASVDTAHSPTITEATSRSGVILGTAAYMSPEQAKGKTIDKRTDIWAFGCVLYEMLTGQRAFPGDTVSETIASLLSREPDWSAIPASTPPFVHRLLAQCLKKDPSHRLHDIADARIEILQGPRERPLEPLKTKLPAIRRTVTMLLAAALALGATLGFLFWRAFISGRGGPVVARITVPISQAGLTASDGGFAVSPDGQTIVFAARGSDEPRLYIRRLNEWEPHPLKGTERALSPIFSPDGKWIAYSLMGEGMKKVPVGGGPPQPVFTLTQRSPLMNPRAVGDQLLISRLVGKVKSALTPRKSEQTRDPN